MRIKDCKDNVGVKGIEISGKIESVYPPKKGTSATYGDYSFQNITISDDTDKIGVSLRNREEMAEDKKGQQVTFESVFVESQKENMGVKVIQDEYKDKEGAEHKVIKLAVTGSAKITYGTPQKPAEEKPTEGRGEKPVSPKPKAISFSVSPP